MVEPMDITDQDEVMLQARDYQEEILDRALKQNVIIYLPTGAGKTFIAVMAIKRMSKVLGKSLHQGGKRTVFVTNTVALAKQQCTVLQKQTNLKCNVYTGDRNVDYWGRDRWDVEFEQTQVIVATCQIIVDIVTSGIIKISDFNLLIFDECHNGTNNHPMHSLMGHFRYVPEKDQPRVIGLTGILMKSPTLNTVIQELTNLEATFRSVIVTVSNLEKFKNVLVYSTKPNEVFIPYKNATIRSSAYEKISVLIEETKERALNWKGDESDFKKTKALNDRAEANPIKTVINRLVDFSYQMNDLGPYGASIAVMTLMISLELRKRSAKTTNMRNLYRMCIATADRIRHLLVQNLYDEDDDEEKEVEVILMNSSPKMQKLLIFLKQQFEGKNPDDISCLLFVQRRTSAKNVYHIVKRFVKASENLPLKPNFMVGRNTSLSEPITAILTDKWSESAINEFRKGDSNFLVASSVLEEGIDVQSCNYVIMYDTILTFRSYVQTKGRARSKESTYAMMVEYSDRDKILKKILEYRQIEQELRKFLIEKAIDRKKPLTEDILRQFPVNIPPFRTPKGAILEAHAALNLLNRYCMSLPGDCFTTFKPKWEKDEYVQTKFTNIVAKVLLPPQSTIKDLIASDPMRNVYLAKTHAAFLACKQLYLNGELNDHLLPITPKISNEITDHLYFKHWENFPQDNPREAGTKKNKRIYDVVYPSELFSGMPEVGKDFFLYAINIQPDFVVDEDNMHIEKLLSMPAQYAIAIKKPLPKLAAMPFFMTQGKLRAKIVDTPKVGKIVTSEELTKLTRFHVMLFRDIMHSWKNYLALNTRDEENSFLIVPTTNGTDIDWNLVERFQNMTSSRAISEIQRSRMKYEPEDYENSVISTWYSSDDQVRYAVLRCRLDLTPLSPFPNDIYPSFASYFKDKYKVSVIKDDQFLIEAQPFTSRMNFIVPGGGEDGKKKKARKIQDILLIPELCHNFKYPADMWLKALFLPTILHRIRYMLLAEKLRTDFNSYLNLNFPNYSPKDLIVDSTLKRVDNTKMLKDVQAPMFPDPKETKPKPMKEVKSFLDQNMYHWKEYEEPCHVDRLMDQVYKIELDYYHDFITNKMNDMSIVGDDSSLSAILVNPESRPAICDTPSDEKMAIKILNISAETVRSPEQWEILSAITASSANDVFDSERMELLGDSFLKFSISLFLLHKHPSWNEGILTEVKGRFVSNRNLLYHSMKLKLPGLLSVSSFKPRDDWQPPLISVPHNAKDILLRDDINPRVLFELKMDSEEIETGVCKQETLANFQTYFRAEDSLHTLESEMHSLVGRSVVSDKACADSMEALLGVCVQSYGIRKTFPILNFMGIINSSEKLENFLDLDMGNPRLKPCITDTEINQLLINCDELEQNIGYKFRDRAYLLQAMTHPSYPTNRLTGCYQQLEFIGDAILDFLVSCYIFERCCEMGPGDLTDLRSALVNNVTLACLSVRYKLHHFMLSQNASLLQAVTKFADFQKTQKFKVTDQCRILLSEDGKVPPMADMIEVPKALGDIFEAVVGAVFLDSKNDLKKTWAFIYGLMSQEIHEFIQHVPKQVVRMLEEYNGASPSWSDPVVDDDIVMITCTFTCRNEIREVDGYGPNSTSAKAAAAKLALQCLQQA